MTNLQITKSKSYKDLVYQQGLFKEPSILEYLRYSEIEYFSKAASHASPVCLSDPYLPTAIEAYSKPHTKTNRYRTSSKYNRIFAETTSGRNV